MADIIFLSIATTGLSKETDHIVRICAHRKSDSDTDEFVRYIKPDCEYEYPEDIQNQNGITREFLEEHGEDEITVLKEFNAYLSKTKSDLVTFNGNTFAIPFLNYACLRNGIEFEALMHRSFDLCDIERRNNRNDFRSTYSRHLGVEPQSQIPSSEDLETLFNAMTSHYNTEQILGDISPLIVDMNGLFRITKSKELIFSRGKHSGEKVYEIIKSDPDYIIFLFKEGIVNGKSKQIIINEYSRLSKSENL